MPFVDFPGILYIRYDIRFGTRNIILYMQILLKPVSLISGILLVIIKNKRVRDPKISLVISIFYYNQSRYKQCILYTAGDDDEEEEEEELYDW